MFHTLLKRICPVWPLATLTSPDTIKIRKPLNKVGSGYKLYYKYKDGTYEETGYYYKNGTSRNEGKVTLVDVGNTVTEINLTTLLFTNKWEGLPAGR